MQCFNVVELKYCKLDLIDLTFPFIDLPLKSQLNSWYNFWTRNIYIIHAQGALPRAFKITVHSSIHYFSSKKKKIIYIDIHLFFIKVSLAWLTSILVYACGFNFKLLTGLCIYEEFLEEVQLLVHSYYHFICLEVNVSNKS